MIISINREILKDAISNLNKNTKFFIINDNLFSIKNINTMLKVRDKLDTWKKSINKETDFSLFDVFYNNGRIKFVYEHENDTCMHYIKLCNLISDDDIEILLNKAKNIAIEKNKQIGEYVSTRKIDEIFMNEVLVFISSKINESDKGNITDDFVSKFELFKTKQNAITTETIALMKELYGMLLNIKLKDN